MGRASITGITLRTMLSSATRSWGDTAYALFGFTPTTASTCEGVHARASLEGVTRGRDEAC